MGHACGVRIELASKDDTAIILKQKTSLCPVASMMRPSWARRCAADSSRKGIVIFRKPSTRVRCLLAAFIAGVAIERFWIPMFDHYGLSGSLRPLRD